MPSAEEAHRRGNFPPQVESRTVRSKHRAKVSSDWTERRTGCREHIRAHQTSTLESQHSFCMPPKPQTDRSAAQSPGDSTEPGGRTTAGDRPPPKSYYTGSFSFLRQKTNGDGFRISKCGQQILSAQYLEGYGKPGIRAWIVKVSASAQSWSGLVAELLSLSTWPWDFFKGGFCGVAQAFPFRAVDGAFRRRFFVQGSGRCVARHEGEY
jgi:hypothetical protein